MSITEIPPVDIPAEAWDVVDDNAMVASMTVAGVRMHVTAYRVTNVDETGVQHCDGYDEELGLLWHVFGMDGPSETATIGGAEWLLFAEPAGR